MGSHDYDLFVIGAGSGGVRASRVAAELGARVAVAESGPLGGTCVNLGCIPKKLFHYGAGYAEHFEDARAYGWDVRVEGFDWRRLVENKDREIARLNGVYQGLLERRGVQIVRGRAKITGPNEVEVAGVRYSAARTLVATGGRPNIPAGCEGCVITSDDVFHLPELPKRLLVIGGGYIAVEMAGFFQGFGVEVTLVHRRGEVLRGFDSDLRREATAELSRRGVTIHVGATVSRVERTAQGAVVILDHGGHLEADLVLAAIGRHPNTAGLGLEDLGVALSESGAVVVDQHFQSSVPSIYALGDVIDRVTLTPVALGEAMVLTRRLFGGRDEVMDYTAIPSAVFGHPPLASVGLTEEEALARGEVDIYTSRFRPLRNTLSGNEARTFMKLVVDAETDRVLGVHVFGEDAPEIVQGFAVAVKLGATKAQLDATVGIHPTAAEELVTMREKRRVTA